MSAFFCKKLAFIVQKITITQSNSVRAVLEIFSSLFSFCKTKGYCYWKHNICRFCVRNPASKLLQIGQKSEKWQSEKFFWRCFVSFFKFSYWPKFHVITGSGIITILFYKGLTRNPEIGNTPVWVLSNIWRLRQVMDTKFDTNVSNKILLNAAKFQGYNSYHFWVKLPPCHTD